MVETKHRANRGLISLSTQNQGKQQSSKGDSCSRAAEQGLAMADYPLPDQAFFGNLVTCNSQYFLLESYLEPKTFYIF